MSASQYLYYSIFYNQNKWNFLLKSLFQIFSTDMYDKNKNIIIIISLSYYRGENVRVSICCKNGEINNYQKSLNSSIQEFLKKYPSRKQDSKFFKEVIFKDFNQNTLQCNLHSFPFENIPIEYNNIFSRLHIMITKMICNTLANDEIEKTSIFTFSFYLQMILLQSLFSSENIMSYTFSYLKVLAIKPAREFLKENQNVFHEITEQIFNINAKTHLENLWILEWQIFCNYLELNLRSKIKNYSFYVLHKQLNKAISMHLGQSDEEQNVLSACLYTCIQHAKKLK